MLDFTPRLRDALTRAKDAKGRWVIGNWDWGGYEVGKDEFVYVLFV